MPGPYVRRCVGRCVPARMAPGAVKTAPYKLPITGGPHFTASLRPHLHRGILPASRQIRAQIDQRIPAGGHAAAVNVPVRHQNAAIVGQGYREIPVPGGIGPGLLIGDLVPRAVVVVESMAAITIVDALFSNMSAQMDALKDFYS